MRYKDAILGRITSGASAALAVVVVVAGVSPAQAQPPVPAPAIMNITVSQVGPDVVMNFIGDINITNLGAPTNISVFSEEYGNARLIYIGGSVASPAVAVAGYSVNLGSLSSAFNPTAPFSPNYATGSIFGIYGTVSYILVPRGYVADTQISGSSTFSGETLAALGLNAGSYSQVYDTSSQINLTISNSVSVPEPASLGLLAAGIAGIGAVRRRKRA